MPPDVPGDGIPSRLGARATHGAIAAVPPIAPHAFFPKVLFRRRSLQLMNTTGGSNARAWAAACPDALRGGNRRARVSDRTYLRRDGRSSARALHPRDLSFGRPSGKREGNLVRFAPRWTDGAQLSYFPAECAMARELLLLYV